MKLTIIKYKNDSHGKSYYIDGDELEITTPSDHIYCSIIDEKSKMIMNDVTYYIGYRYGLNVSLPLYNSVTGTRILISEESIIERVENSKADQINQLFDLVKDCHSFNINDKVMVIDSIDVEFEKGNVDAKISIHMNKSASSINIDFFMDSYSQYMSTPNVVYSDSANFDMSFSNFEDVSHCWQAWNINMLNSPETIINSIFKIYPKLVYTKDGNGNISIVDFKDQLDDLELSRYINRLYLTNSEYDIISNDHFMDAIRNTSAAYLVFGRFNVTFKTKDNKDLTFLEIYNDTELTLFLMQNSKSNGNIAIFDLSDKEEFLTLMERSRNENPRS